MFFRRLGTRVADEIFFFPSFDLLNTHVKCNGNEIFAILKQYVQTTKQSLLGLGLGYKKKGYFRSHFRFLPRFRLT